MSDKKIMDAFEKSIEELECVDGASGVLTATLSDGSVLEAKFHNVSPQEWKEVEEKQKRGLLGLLGF